MIAEPPTVVTETEAEIGALQRDVNLWKKSTCEYLSVELSFDCTEEA